MWFCLNVLSIDVMLLARKYYFIRLMSQSMKKGIYQHYKGPLYQVFNVATHSETEEKLVVYQCLYGDYSLWVRPLAMFSETVEYEGKTVERFKLIQEVE